MPLFEVELPDGRILEIENVADQAAARARAQRFLDEERGPQAPAEDNRPLTGTGTSLWRGFRQGVGGGVQGAGGVLEYAGVPGGESIRSLGNAIVGEDPRNPEQSPTRDVRLRDFLTQPLAAAGNLGGQVVGNLAGMAVGGLGVGLGVRAAAGVLGAGARAASRAGVAAGTGAVAASGALAGQPELEGALIAEGVSPERALELSALIGPAIGAGEVAGPLALLNRALGRQVSQATAQAIAAAGARRSIRREATFGAGTEALSEAFGDAARQSVVAAETGNLNLGERAEQVALGALGGAFGGGAAGVPLGIHRFRQAQAQAGPPPDQAPAPAPPLPEPSGPQLPPEPTAMATPEEAEDFLARSGRRPRVPLEGDALVQHANVEARRLWQEQVREVRSQELNRYLEVDKVETTSGLPTADGKPTLQRRQDVQARALLPKLYGEATQGTLDLEQGFTARDVAENVLVELGGNPTHREVTAVQDALNGMVAQGFLTRRVQGGKKKTVKYALAPSIDLGALRQQAEVKAKQAAEGAPLTADQKAAQQAMMWLESGQLLTATPEQLKAAYKALKTETPEGDKRQTVAQLTQALVENTRALGELEQKLADPKLPDEERQKVEEDKRGLLQQQANNSELLAGYREPGVIAPPALRNEEGQREAPSPEVRYAPRGQPGVVDPMWETGAELQMLMQREEFPAALRDIAQKSGNVYMPAKAWQAEFQKAGMNLTPEQAIEVYRFAQRQGIINNLGKVQQPQPGAPVVQQPQPQQPSAPPVAPTRGPLPAPSVPPKPGPLPTEGPPAPPKWVSPLEGQWQDFLRGPQAESVLRGMLLGAKGFVGQGFWAKEFGDAGVRLSPKQAQDVNRRAQELGLVNKMGMPLEQKLQVEMPKETKAEPEAYALPPEDTTAEQPLYALPPGSTEASRGTEAAEIVNGRVVWSDGDLAIVEAYDQWGDPVYVPVVGETLFSKSIGRMQEGPVYTAEVKKRMDEQLARIQQEDAAKSVRDPFDGKRFVKSETLDDRLFNFGQALVKMLALPEDVRVMFVSYADAQQEGFIDKHNLYGDSGRFRFVTRPQNSNLGELIRQKDGKTFLIAVNPNLKLEVGLETIAHEIGHIFEHVALKNVPQEVRNALMAAHVKWLRENRGKRADAYVRALRTFAAGELMTQNSAYSSMDAESLSFYWKSWQEWMADQVARWATTQREPQTLVEKFFHTIGQAYVKLVNSLKGLTPDQTVVDFIQAYRDGKYQNPTGVSIESPPLQASVGTLTRNVRDQITGTMRWVASPITTMPVMRPALREQADVGKQLGQRRAYVVQKVENSLRAFLKLGPEAQKRVSRLWEQASRTRKAPPWATLDPTEAAALRELISGPQEALSLYIESAVWNHYDPDAAKGADRARLEKFWERHQGKALLEIPKAELRTASPEGFKAIQEMEALRNPFYMPVIAEGSHFIAAYAKGPDGKPKGPPLRMYAFTPRNMFQRMMKFEDPAIAAEAAFKAEFGSRPGVVLQLEPTQFTQDAMAAKIKNQGDFIASYLERLKDLKGPDARAKLAELQREFNKAHIERIFKPNQDILRAITPYNEGSYVMDVMPRYFAGMASVIARRHTQEAWARAMKKLSPNDQNFLNELREYSTMPTEAYGGLRTLAFLWFMGAAPDTAMVNLLQVTQVTAPMMVRDGGVRSLKHLKSAYKDVLRHTGKVYANPDMLTRTMAEDLTDPDEKAAITKAMEVGNLNPVVTDETRGQVTVGGMRPLFGAAAPKAALKINQAVRWAAVLQQSAEQVNRMTTFLAAYRMAKAQPDVIRKFNEFHKTGYKDPLSYAMGMVDQTQLMTTKEDRAYFQRFTPGAELMTQFMSFPAKITELFAQHLLKLGPAAMKDNPQMARAGAMGVMLMMAPMIGLAGIWSLPFAESLRELFEKIASFFWGSTQNFDADLRRWMGNTKFAEVLTRGGPHAANIASLGRRLALDPVPYQELTAFSALSVLGPVGSIPEAYARAFERAQRGDYTNALALMMPRSIGNVVRGVDLAAGTQEYRTDKGRTLVTAEQLQQQASLAHMALRQGGGFPHPEVGRRRENVLRAEEIDRQNVKATESLNAELSRHLTTALRHGERGEAAEAARAYRAFEQRLVELDRKNMQAMAEDRIDLVVRPNIGAIRRRAWEDFRGLSDPDVMVRRAGPLRREWTAQEVGASERN